MKFSSLKSVWNNAKIKIIIYPTIQTHSFFFKKNQTKFDLKQIFINQCIYFIYSYKKWLFPVEMDNWQMIDLNQLLNSIHDTIMKIFQRRCHEIWVI